MSVLGPQFLSGFINECSASLLLNVDFRTRVFLYYSVLSPKAFSSIFNLAGMSSRLHRLDAMFELISDSQVEWTAKHSRELCRRVPINDADPVGVELIEIVYEEADAASRRFPCLELCLCRLQM